MTVRRVVASEAPAVTSDLKKLDAELKRGDRIRRGDQGDEVKALQRDLIRVGCPPGPVDGDFGPVTAAAVKKFQHSQGLRETGVVDGRTLSALKSAHVFVDDNFAQPAKRGQSGKDILGVERKLNALGIDTGKVDGVFDNQTLKAVRGLRKQEAGLDDNSRSIDGAFAARVDARLATARATTSRADRTLESFNRTEPAHDYHRVSFRGVTVNRRTEEMIKRAEFVMRHELGHKGFKFELTQGSYSGSVGASAGTHDGGGALDIRTRGFSNARIDDMTKALRTAGFAAWSRGRGHDSFSPHIHAIALGDRELSGRGSSFGAFDQIPDYANGKNGLSNHARDPDRALGRPVPAWARKYL